MYGWRRQLPAAMSNMECADAPQSLHHARPTNTHCKSSQIHTTSNKKYRVQEYTNTFLSTRINLYTCLYHYKSLHTAIHCSHTQYLSTKLGPEKSSLKLCNVSTLQCVGRQVQLVKSSRAIIGGAIFLAVSWLKSPLITVLASCNIPEFFRKVFFRPTLLLLCCLLAKYLSNNGSTIVVSNIY